MFRQTLKFKPSTSSHAISQSTWRRFRDRTAYLHYRQRQWAAGVIAISWIMNCKLSMVRKQLKHLRQTQAEKFKLRSRVSEADH